MQIRSEPTAFVASRRSILILAGVLALPAMSRAAGTESLHVWEGTAMGTEARLLLESRPVGDAQAAADAVVREIGRLEDIFSLYRPDSALVRLNTHGRIEGPPKDLVALLRLCDRLHAATGGLFDPTVQPLWRHVADAFANGRENLPDPLSSALDRPGFGRVGITDERIEFLEAGMEVTLNGIAQGYIADRVRDVLRTMGYGHALVDTGEFAALGNHPAGRRWEVAVDSPRRDTDGWRWSLADRAVATSARTMGASPAGMPHILDPRTGRPAWLHAQISLRGPSAAIADGLSTAFMLMDADAIVSTIRVFPGYAAVVWDRQGGRTLYGHS